MVKQIKLLFLILLIQSIKTDDSTTIDDSKIDTTSSSTTNPFISSTTQSPPTHLTNEDNQTLVFKNSTRYCSCDLTGNLCDQNCCCDLECGSESKKLFSKCLDDSRNYNLLDPKYCFNQNIIYKNNTNYILERMTNVGGLFCIYADNTKQQSYLMDQKIVTKLKELNALNLKPEYNWTSSLKVNYDLSSPELVDINRMSNQYRADRDIYILDLKKIDKSKQIKILSKLSFPFSKVLRNSECNSQRKVTYLNDFESYCYQMIRNLQSECKSNTVYDVQNYYLFLIGNGGHSIDHELPSGDLNKFCTQYNCIKTVTRNQVKLISYDNQVCSNVLKSVSYLIIYNEKVGIKKVIVDFEYVDLKQSDNKPIKHYQKFNVKFMHEDLLNEKSSNLSHYSGNLGYQLEKPLIGKFWNKIDNKNVTLAYEFVNLQQDNDECDINKVNEQQILFGLNHRSGCLFNINKNLANLETELQSNRQTWTNEYICEHLNDLIYKVFQQERKQNLTFKDQLSAYGKYNLSSEDNWVTILKSKKLSTPSIVTENNLSGIKTNCQLLKQINYQFIYAMVADEREPQRKLISSVQTQISHSFEICLNGFLCSNQPIELSTSIQFVQMKRGKRMRFANVPAFKLELPDDFFYPFV